MEEKEIYEELGQIVFDASPSVESEIHFLFCLSESGISCDQLMWYGPNLAGDNSFRLSGKLSIKVFKLVIALNKLYAEAQLGVWNVGHFVVTPKNRKFSISFEHNEDLIGRKTTFLDYAEKYRA